MAEAFQKAIPILRIFDEAKAREFYVDYLGFKVDWEHRFEPGLPLYMQVSRGALVLHLTEHHGDACPGSALFVRMTGIEQFHAELAAKNYGNARPGIESTPWNSREVTVKDPFGNRLSFNEYNREPNTG
jgi:uncharacterized glyoxalase superfamily protein PhnB